MFFLNSPFKSLSTLLLLTFILYYPGLYGDFILDDMSNIVDEPTIKIETINFNTLSTVATSGISGPLKRPVSNISFALNYYFFDLDPYYFKLINVILHLLTGVCIYVFCSMLIVKLSEGKNEHVTPHSIALLCTALWLLHPLNISSVLYVVQRMNELAALFTFLSLISYCLFRDRLASSQNIWIVYLLMYLFTASIAILSKENALLIFSFSFLIEFTVFKFKLQNKKQKWLLYSLHLLLFVFPITFYLLIYFDIQALKNAYIDRPFSLIERIYSELNILIFYLKQILIPNILEQSIFHDGWPVTKELLSSSKTILSGIIILTLVLSALFSYKRNPVISFGILWFFIGHSLESTIFPLELIFEHRNYVPMFGLLFIISFYTLSYLSSKRQLIRFIIISTYLLFISTSTILKAKEWGDPTIHITSEQQRHPESYRANLQLGNLYKKAAVLNINKDANIQQQLIDKSLQHYQIATQLNNYFTVAYLGSILLYAELQREIPPSLLKEYNQSLKSNQIHISTAVNFSKLNTCYFQSDCQISSAQVETLYTSILSNPNILEIHRAIVSAYYGDYFQKKNDLENALQYILSAHQNNLGEITYTTRLINILLLMKRFNQVKAIINKIEKKDMTKDILDIKNALNNHQ